MDNTVDNLKEDYLVFTHGIRLEAMLDQQDRIIACKFSHPSRTGVCQRIIPITTRGSLKTLYRRRVWRINKQGPVNMLPSLVCPEHRIHGMIFNGKWIPLPYRVGHVWTISRYLAKGVGLTKGLVVYRKGDPEIFVLAEYDTRTEEQTELIHSPSLQAVLGEVPGMERLGDYDGGVVIDLTNPIE